MSSEDSSTYLSQDAFSRSRIWPRFCKDFSRPRIRQNSGADLPDHWCDHDLGRIIEMTDSTKRLDGTWRSLIWTRSLTIFEINDPNMIWGRSSADFGCHWSERDLGWMMEIIDLIKILDGSSISLIWPRSWMGHRDHWPEQDLARISETTELSKILDGSSRSPTRPNSWVDIRNHWSDRDFGLIFGITKTTKILMDLGDHWSNYIMDESSKSVSRPQILDRPSTSPRQSWSWNDIRDHRHNHDLGRI